MKVTILNDAKLDGIIYTVLRTEPKLPSPIVNMPFVSWTTLGLDHDKTFDSNNSMPQHCFGLGKDFLEWKLHRELKFDKKIQYVSFNLDILTLFADQPEGWAESYPTCNVTGSLEYLYAIDKKYLLCLDGPVKPEEDQGYTQGYKDGCTGLKWL